MKDIASEDKKVADQSYAAKFQALSLAYLYKTKQKRKMNVWNNKEKTLYLATLDLEGEPEESNVVLSPSKNALAKGEYDRLKKDVGVEPEEATLYYQFPTEDNRCYRVGILALQETAEMDSKTITYQIQQHLQYCTDEQLEELPDSNQPSGSTEE